MPEEECTFQIVRYNLQYENENLEIFNAGINDLTEDEKKVLIYVIKNDSINRDRLEFRQTKHFFVIFAGKKFFFRKLALIKDTVTKKEGSSVDETGESNNFKGIKTLIESKESCYKFEFIDFS